MDYCLYFSSHWAWTKPPGFHCCVWARPRPRPHVLERISTRSWVITHLISIVIGWSRGWSCVQASLQRHSTSTTGALFPTMKLVEHLKTWLCVIIMRNIGDFMDCRIPTPSIVVLQSPAALPFLLLCDVFFNSEVGSHLLYKGAALWLQTFHFTPALRGPPAGCLCHSLIDSYKVTIVWSQVRNSPLSLNCLKTMAACRTRVTRLFVSLLNYGTSWNRVLQK